jgi:hypothetical protein
MKAIVANVRTRALSETVIDVKVIPMNDNPKNKPIKPSNPKLNATDKTSNSIRSILFLPKNRIFTKQ